MLIRIGYEIVFDSPVPVPMILMLYTHPSRAGSLKKPDQLKIDPEITVEKFIDSFGNLCGRIVAPAGRLKLFNEAIVEDSGQLDTVNWNAAQIAVPDLPAETIQYLLGSRYCEVDRLSDIAWNLFGQTAPGWARVQAVCDWVHSHIRYGYEYARSTKTAYDVYTEGTGVCRDFTHLALTFCRCLNIPARYVTGYLGDIGVPPQPTPMDFHAWFEVFLDGKWYAFDARHNVPRVGRVLIARGRDAVDVALTTSFGPNTLVEFNVWTDEISEQELFVVAS